MLTPVTRGFALSVGGTAIIEQLSILRLIHRTFREARVAGLDYTGQSQKAVFRSGENAVTGVLGGLREF